MQRPGSGLGRSMLSPKTPIADGTLSLQLQQFLDDYFFRVMSSSLGKTWTRRDALKASLQLFQLNGVQLSDEDIEWCSDHDDHMIPLIVRKMPPSIRENFDSISTQLNVLVLTATKVRTAVEQDEKDDKDGKGEKGDGSRIQEIIADQDTGAIKEQILKESVISASKEVAKLLQCQETWVQSMDRRLLRLSRSAELAESANQQLMRVETQLEGLSDKCSAKSKMAMMGFAEHSTRNLLHSTFANWGAVATKYKAERDIRKKFEQEMTDKETMLIKLKERAMVNVKNALLRKSKDNAESCMEHFFEVWKDEVGADQREEEEKKQLAQLEKQMAEFTETKANNARKFMARAGADNDDALFCMAFAAWSKGVQVLKADNEIAAEAQKIEGQLAQFKSKARNNNAKVLEKMGASTDTSLLTNAVQGWHAYTKDAKQSRDLENTLMGNEGKFKMLNDRQKGSATKVQTRVNEQMKQNLLLRVLAVWQLEAKVNHVDQYFNKKMDGKRKQLQSVQTLFKSFAKQLEEGLGKIDEDGGDSTGRTTKPSKKHGMSGSKHDKEGGSVSLPDIHSRR